MEIPFYCSKTPLEVVDGEELSSLGDGVLLGRDWSGAEVIPGFRTVIAFDRLHFYLFGERHGVRPNAKNQKMGSFVEGLWTEDAVECFLRNPDTGAYQEFNLSPFGAWWSARFASYRERAPGSANSTEADAHGKVSSSGFSAFLRYPRSELEVWGIELEKCEVHLSAVALSESGERYLSSRPDGTVAPDFHRKESFAVPRLIEI